MTSTSRVRGRILPLRHRLDNANIALLLVVSIVAIAISGRRPAAAVAALSAALQGNRLEESLFQSDLTGRLPSLSDARLYTNLSRREGRSTTIVIEKL